MQRLKLDAWTSGTRELPKELVFELKVIQALVSNTTYTVESNISALHDSGLSEFFFK